MNAGLGSLANLKASVLPDGLRESTEYDNALLALGRGAADMMQVHCNRLFDRVEDDVFDCPAHTSALCVPRFPLEDIASLTMRPAGGTVWEDIMDQVTNRFDSAGVIELGAIMGTHQDVLRVTYTGGWWWDTTEDGTAVKPEGATELPYAVQHLWHMQCQAVIEHTNLLTTQSAKSSEESDSIRALRQLDMLPIVKSGLASYIRYV
jgi:hypothetical protein